MLAGKKGLNSFFSTPDQEKNSTLAQDFYGNIFNRTMEYIQQ